MRDVQISTYGEPRWGSRPIGTAIISKDDQACYFIDRVSIVDMRVIDLFTILTCSDGHNYNVLTVFFHQVDRPPLVIE